MTQMCNGSVAHRYFILDLVKVASLVLYEIPRSYLACLLGRYRRVLLQHKQDEAEQIEVACGFGEACSEFLLVHWVSWQAQPSI